MKNITKKRMNRRVGSVLAAFTFLVLGFQNCTPFSLGTVSQNAVSETEDPTDPVEPLTQDIAKVLITTENAAPVNSKDTYVNGRLQILPDGTASTNAFDAVMKIKGRGNFTWTLEKKPYKIKLNTKASVIGLPADKEWVLLANHVDRTLFRTTLAYEFSRRLGTEYVPRARNVEVNLNGEDIGTYILTEQIKVSASRVNITEMAATDISGEALTGGYLLELDERMDETNVWRTTRGVPYAIKEPSEATTEQVDYIKNHLQMIEDVLNSDDFADPVNGYAKYIDVDSFINLYLVHELFKNKDAANFSSIFLFKDRNGKLKMGPPWDFDLAGGNSDVASINDPVGWHLRTGSPWYSRLFQDPAFEAKVRAKWNAMKTSQIDTLQTYIDDQAYRLALSQVRNFTIWPILSYAFFPASVVPGSYAGEVAQLKTWLQNRVTWMDAQFNPPTM